MGCIDSNPSMPPRTPNVSAPVQNYNNNTSTMFYQMQNKKRPKFLNQNQLSQPQKDALWSIIQRNSLRQFAYYLQNQRIPSNIQIGPANTFWNFAHFCARWDAFQCLYYVVRRVYAENRTLQLSLMNQQTIQGFTPLHIAIQWNSINCFYMLLDCGGVDMSYKDNANNDVFVKANLFKRAQMAQVLEKFKAANALMVLVQAEQVRGFQNFSQMVASGQTQARKQFRLTNQRIDQIIDTPNRLNRPPPPPPIQNTNNPNKYQDYQNNMKQIEQQKQKNSNNSSTQMSQGDYEQINRKKLQQQARFQEEEARIKKQQAQELKRRINAQKQEEEKRLKAEIQTQIKKQIVYEQAELAKIQKQKQLMRKNIEMMQSSVSANANVGKGTKMVCPQDIRPIYEAALAKKVKFVDESFPANSTSLGNIQDFRFGWQDCVWLRPQQMFPGGKFQVFDGISPDDVKQGTLAVCYYLALLSSIAENQKRIKKIFKFYDKDLGFYALQLYLQGKPITVIVDDQIPCMKGTNQPLFSKPNGAQVWVMIFEKAWVKMFGNYLAAEKMNPAEMFENVLPAPCTGQVIDVSKIDQTFDKLVEYDKKHYIMVTSSSSGKNTPPGIVQEHAYSLIGLYNINGIRLCKLRNPWGKTEYSGMYSETSTLWTPELKRAVGFSAGEDGIFFLTPTELQSTMPCIAVSMCRDDYEYSYVEMNSKSSEYSYFIVNIKKKGQVAIKVTQQNQRFKKNMEWENSPIRFEVCRIGDNYDATIISEGEPSVMYGGCTNLYSTSNIYQSLQAGRYLIRVKVLFDRTHSVSTRGTMRKFIRGTNGKDILVVRQGKSVLSMYGPETYIFNKISIEQGQKYMRNVYKNYILSSKNASQRFTSVGQDLKPMVIAKDCKMKNQIIYYAQNLFPKNSINFTFKFSHVKFRNSSYMYNIDTQKQVCAWVLQPGGYNLAALEIDCPFQEVATEGQLHTDFKIIR